MRAAPSKGPRLLNEVTAGLRDQGLRVEAVDTESEADMLTALAAADNRRVVLVGGDCSLHAVATAASHGRRISR